MLDDYRRGIIEDNINLVYKFFRVYNIDDEDEQSDYLCEYCEIVNRMNDKQREEYFSHCLWYSLENYRKKKYVKLNAQKRKGYYVVSMQQCPSSCSNADGEEFTYESVIEGKKADFTSASTQELIGQIREVLNAQPTKSMPNVKVTMGDLFDAMVEASNKNEVVNWAQFAREHNISAQRIQEIKNKVRKLTKEVV